MKFRYIMVYQTPTGLVTTVSSNDAFIMGRGRYAISRGYPILSLKSRPL